MNYPINILEELKKLKPKNTSIAKRTTPADKEIDDTLIKNRNNNRLSSYNKALKHHLILILKGTALRCNEIYHVQIEDINFIEKTLFVRKAKGGVSRKIGLTKATQQTIKDFLKIRNNIPSNEKHLFIKENGKRYSSSKALGRNVTNSFRNAGYKHSCHSLRRKSSQDLVFKHNISLPIVAEFLGHNANNIQTLMTSYCLVKQDQAVNAIKNLKEKKYDNKYNNTEENRIFTKGKNR